MIILKNANVIEKDNDLTLKTVVIDGERIVDVLENEEQYVVNDEDLVMDCRGKLLVPSFIDSHVHLREPGFTHKETIKTGTLSALKGGYTKIFAMPNTKPTTDSLENVLKVKEIIKKDAVIDVEVFSSITKSELGKELVEIEDIGKSGTLFFSDDGRGIQSTQMMLEAMKRVEKIGGIISAHTEDETILEGGYINFGSYSKKHNHKGILNAVEDAQIARDIVLADTTNVKYHICHMSTKRGAELLKLARNWNENISGEVAPHHLILNEDDLKEDGNYKMNPPLRTKEDNEALIKALNEKVIKCIATDHAPHSAIEKSKGLKDSPFGIVGLETSFALLYTKLVKEGKVTLETIVNAMGKNVSQVFNLEEKEVKKGYIADLTLIDLDKKWTIKSEEFLSMGRNTPFENYEVYGYIDTVIHRGKIKMVGGKING